MQKTNSEGFKESVIKKSSITEYFIPSDNIIDFISSLQSCEGGF